MEIWARVPDFNERYWVSTYGRVWRKAYKVRMPNGGYRHYKGRELKYDMPQGYPQVTLSKEGKQRRFKVHRLVAMLFIPNPEDKPEVNHLDGDRSNNDVTNLEWCTTSENQLHSVHVLNNYPIRKGEGIHYRSSHKKPWIAQISIRGKKKHIGSFSTKEEAKEAYRKEVENVCV